MLKHAANIGDAHKVTRKDGNICTTEGEEFDRKLDALLCNKEYMRAVREEIEGATVLT